MSLRIAAVVIRFEGGGAERSVARMAEAARASTPTIVRIALDAPLPAESPAAGVVLNGEGRRGVLRLLVSATRLRLWLRHARPDVLHLHCEGPELVGLLSLVLLRGRPVVVVTEHSMGSWQRAPWLGRAVRRWFAARGGVVVSCFVDPAYPERRVIRNPLELAGPVSPQPQGGRCARLVILSRLTAAKRVEMVLDAAHVMGWDRPILVIGDGPSRAMLTARARTLGLDVTMAGYQGEPWSLVVEGDLIVSASAYEGEPLALVEAVVRRVPVLVSDIPAHRELLGEAVPMFGDVETLADQLRQVAQHGTDTCVVDDRLRDAVISERLPGTVLAQWLDVYERASQGAPRRRKPVPGRVSRS